MKNIQDFTDSELAEELIRRENIRNKRMQGVYRGEIQDVDVQDIHEEHFGCGSNKWGF